MNSGIAFGAEYEAVSHMARGEEPTPDGSRRSAYMRTQNQAIPPIGPRHQEIATRECHGLQEPKTREKQFPDSSALSNDGWVAPYFVPNKNGPSSLPPQNNVDAGKDGSKMLGWQSSDEFRQHRFVDRDNQ